MRDKIIIAIDGPAGSGKSTTARRVAQELGYLYIDTGAMYRAVTLAVLRENKEVNEASLSEILRNYSVLLRVTEVGQRTYLNNEDVTMQIRLPEVTALVSAVSALGNVREAMVRQQQELGRQGGVVMDGRDIGTVVFPQAELKIYLVASPGERAQRRVLELEAQGIEVSAREVEQQIVERDRMDSERDISPLRKAADAIEIDTSHLSIEDQTRKVVELACRRIDLLGQ
jgi:cytidylate kinase